MARFKLVLAFFALMVMTAGVAGAAYYWQKYVRPQKVVEVKISGKTTEPKPDLGRKHYVKAVDFINEGELISARNQLQYMLDIYPESPTIPEAKRVLGEVNLDLIVSKIPLEGKTTYKVKSGDALSRIARNSKTTIDYIMRANAKTTTMIYAKEDLTVFDLTCGMVIDMDNMTLTVTDGENQELFIKEYKILDINLPSQFPRTEIKTTISSKVANHNGRVITFMDSNYLNSLKWIRTGRNGLFIRQFVPEDQLAEGAPKPYGVMVAREDLEELFTIIRNSSSVKVLARTKKKR